MRVNLRVCKYIYTHTHTLTHTHIYVFGFVSFFNCDVTVQHIKHYAMETLSLLTMMSQSNMLASMSWGLLLCLL